MEKNESGDETYSDELVQRNIEPFWNGETFIKWWECEWLYKVVYPLMQY